MASFEKLSADACRGRVGRVLAAKRFTALAPVSTPPSPMRSRFIYSDANSLGLFRRDCLKIL